MIRSALQITLLTFEGSVTFCFGELTSLELNMFADSLFFQPNLALIRGFSQIYRKNQIQVLESESLLSRK